jgi:hypothetical protein
LVLYAVELPLMSDGRIALHELSAGKQPAAVECVIDGQISAWGTVTLQDNQCTLILCHGVDNGPLPVRLYGTSFSLGSTVALRPGFGPAQLFEVVRCTQLETAAPSSWLPIETEESA